MYFFVYLFNENHHHHHHLGEDLSYSALHGGMIVSFSTDICTFAG